MKEQFEEHYEEAVKVEEQSWAMKRYWQTNPALIVSTFKLHRLAKEAAVSWERLDKLKTAADSFTKGPNLHVRVSASGEISELPLTFALHAISFRVNRPYEY